MKPEKPERRSSVSLSHTEMNSAQQYSRESEYYSTASQKRTNRGKKIAIGILGVLFVLLIGGGTAFAWYVNTINESLSSGKTDEELEDIADILAPVYNYNDPFYMLLIGSDARSGDASLGQRSDTNILVRIDPNECVVTIVSIPRDTKIDLDGYGTEKFNAAYAYGGAAATIKEASDLCGVDVSHYAEIDFDKLIALVDAVGGVEIDVKERINNPKAGNVVLEPGVQTLTGEGALVYARDRDYVDGDFTRTSHQRELIEALVKKIMNLPITELPGVIQKAAECVTTDFTLEQLVDLALQFKDIGGLTMYSAMIPSSTATIDGISYVITDEAAFTEMMQVIDAGGDPSLENPTEENSDTENPSTENSS